MRLVTRCLLSLILVAGGVGALEAPASAAGYATRITLDLSQLVAPHRAPVQFSSFLEVRSGSRWTASGGGQGRVLLERRLPGSTTWTRYASGTGFSQWSFLAARNASFRLRYLGVSGRYLPSVSPVKVQRVTRRVELTLKGDLVRGTTSPAWTNRAVVVERAVGYGGRYRDYRIAHTNARGVFGYRPPSPTTKGAQWYFRFRVPASTNFVRSRSSQDIYTVPDTTK